VFFPPAPAQSVTFHTDAGDIKLEVFCEAVPRAAEVLSLVFFFWLFLLTFKLPFFLSFFLSSLLELFGPLWQWILQWLRVSQVAAPPLFKVWGAGGRFFLLETDSEGILFLHCVCVWHRNIKGFMTQTGDPSNTGKGGESIWGRKFADEFRPTLKVFSSSFLAPPAQISVFNPHPSLLLFIAQCPRDCVLRQQRTGHQWLPIFHHVRQTDSPGQCLHNPGKVRIAWPLFPLMSFATNTVDLIIRRVIDGFDTLDALEKVPVNEKNRPLNPVKIKSVTIHANPLAAE